MRRLAIGDHGTDVRHLQEAINARARTRDLRGVHVDGRFGRQTRAAAERVARALGAREDSIERRPLPVGIQRIIRWPATRTPLQLKRARDRQGAHKLAPAVMYDSIDLSQIPPEAKAVAGYIGGHWPTYPDVVKRWPHARHVSIAVASRYDADILDIEPGDAPPELADEWMKRQFANGARRPGVYCSVSAAQHVVDLLEKAGIHRSQYRLWTAHYTEKAHICDSSCGFGLKGPADATQWTSKALGRTLDASRCAITFWRGT